MSAQSVAVNQLTAYAHVADIGRTSSFYEHLGFECVSDWDHDGRRVWALLQSEQARLMIEIASHPIDPHAQAVLFYCYTANVSGLRRQLSEAGIEVSKVKYPEHMPNGEIRVSDPDGYGLIIGQPEPLDT